LISPFLIQPMPILVLLISIFSLVIIRHIKSELFITQLVWMVIGFVVFFIVRRLRIDVFRALWPILYIISLLSLIIVFFGPEVRGTHRWLELFNQRLQPSEMVKPFIMVSLAGFIAGRTQHRFRDFLICVGLFTPVFLLIFKEPDLGNALVFLFMFFTVLMVSPFRPFYYLVPIIGGLLSVPLAWNHLADYQKTRFITFINPSYDMQGAGYNALQALIAVGSGGLFGRGLGAGTQSMLRFLPEFHTDFIFASTVEQLGFVGGFMLLILYFVLLMLVLQSGRGDDAFRRLVSYGAFAQLFFQVLVNVGMNMAVIPITGITLPLFS